MIDGHCHLRSGHAHVSHAMKELYGLAMALGVKGIVLLNLEESGYANIDVIEESLRYDNFFSIFPCVCPCDKNSNKILADMKQAGAAGLKLHPRLHGYRVDDKACVQLIDEAGSLGMPIMIDAFPDGRSALMGHAIEAYAKVADKVPHARIAIGHAGGHKVLDAMMVAKSFKNIYLDFSYTLLYYRASSVMKDIAYAINSIKGERVFWGTDYPDRPYDSSVRMSVEELEKMGLSRDIYQSVVEANVREYLIG